jgi:hypothetical protein
MSGDMWIDLPRLICALRTRCSLKGAMSEVESDRQRGTVRATVNRSPQANYWTCAPTLDRPPQIANDNQPAWNLVPFPDGWYASC